MARRKLALGDYLDTSNYTPPNVSVSAPTTGMKLDFKYPVRKKFDWQKVSDATGQLAPYLSNIANSFRRPPNIAPPSLVDYVRPTRVSFDSQRVEADREMRGMNSGADRGLDENTAAAVKSANLASQIRGRNSIAEHETNVNAQMQGQTNQINAAINSQNVGYENQNKRDLVEADVANQREKSQNLANASDKFMMQQGERDRQKLDADKFAVMSQIWKDSGVTDRIIAGLKKQGIMTPEAKAFGGRLKAFAVGGVIPPPAGSTYQGTFDNPDSDLNTSLDGLNYSIVKGGNPLANVQGKQMMNSVDKMYPGEGRKLVTNLSIFNSRPDLAGKSPEQKLDMFYNMYPSKVTNRLKVVGHGPVAMYHNTPNVDTRTASMARGGRLKAF